MAIRIDRAPVTRATQRERTSLGGVAIKGISGSGSNRSCIPAPTGSRMLLRHQRRQLLQVLGTGMGIPQDRFEVVTALIQGA